MSSTTLLLMTFSFEIILLSQNLVQRSSIMKFEFLIVRTKSDGEMTKIKLVDLNEFYNFVVYHFSI